MALTKVTYAMIQGAPVNVMDYGAKGDGTTDDTAAIQSAINALANGGNLYVPAGRYKLTNQINVPYTINIYGDGWQPHSGQTPGAGSGTIFICTFQPATATNVFYVTAPGVQFRNLEILCNYQPADTSGWTPITTPNAIQFYRAPYTTVGADDPVIDRVMISYMSVGVYVNGSNRGEFDIYGFTFGPLLYIDGNFDVSHIKNVHFWPFETGTPTTNIIDWVRKNSVAIRFGRSDNPVVDKLFAFGVYAGIQFSATTRTEGGAVQNAQLSNIGVDDCFYGILVDQNISEVSAEIANLYVYCNSAVGTTIVPSRGIFILTSTIAKYFNIANAYFLECGGEAMRIDCNDSVVQVSNLKVGDLYHTGYNQENNNFSAVYASNGVKINVGQYNIVTSTANGAPAFRAADGGIMVKADVKVQAANTASDSPGYEQYIATVGTGSPVMLTRNFNRKFVNISGAGTYSWTDTLAVPYASETLRASVSSGSSSIYNVTNLCVYPNTGLPIVGAQTTVSGEFTTTATSGTVYVDWEVVGY